MNTDASVIVPAPMFRKKPVVISAMQWDGTAASAIQIAATLDPIAETGTLPKLDYIDKGGEVELFANTLEGKLSASPGDFIIKGVKGELYACKPDIFAMTYEPAAAPAQAAPEGVRNDFKPAFDMPISAAEAIAMLTAWGSPLCATFCHKKAGRAAQLLGGGFDFAAHLAHQAKWSESTFGPGKRTEGVTDHIRKELGEILADPEDSAEWIDVVILALDGAWRSGLSPQEIIAGIVAKQVKNEGRTWPDWRTADPSKAIEHDRSGEPTRPSSNGGLTAAEVEALERMESALGDWIGSDASHDNATILCAAVRRLSGAVSVDEGMALDAARYRRLRDATDGPFIADYFLGNKNDIRQLTGAIADAALQAKAP